MTRPAIFTLRTSRAAAASDVRMYPPLDFVQSTVAHGVHALWASEAAPDWDTPGIAIDAIAASAAVRDE